MHIASPSFMCRLSPRGGWSHYYMHGAAPIMQYMAASTQFNPLSQQIIIYVRAITIRIDVIRNVRSIIIQYRDQPPLIVTYHYHCRPFNSTAMLAVIYSLVLRFCSIMGTEISVDSHHQPPPSAHTQFGNPCMHAQYKNNHDSNFSFEAARFCNSR